MNRALWKKCIFESVILFTACAIGIASFSWFRVHVVGEVDTSTFQKILDLLPQQWLQFMTVDVEWMVSFVGRTAMTLDEPFLVMLVAIWAIVRGSDIVSGEISRGTMEMLLSQPISRKNLFLTHTAINLGGVVLLSAIAWAGMWLAVHTTSVPTQENPPASGWNVFQHALQLSVPEPVTVHKPMSEFVDTQLFGPGIFNLMLLGFFVTSLATLVSSVDRYRWRTLGISVGLYMIASMIKILGMSSETFRWSSWITFYSLYEPESDIQLFQQDPATFWQLSRFGEQGVWLGFGPLGHNAILATLTIVFLTLAYFFFQRRDIPAPV